MADTVVTVEVGSMADPVIPEAFAAQAMSTLLQLGNIAQANMITVSKVVDFDYLENKRMVTLDEAVGVREVSSKRVPAGPESGA